MDIPFFLRSGFPFLTEQIIISPIQAAGNRLSLPLIPLTPKMYKFLAPELSAQFRRAAVGKPREILNLVPDAPPRPRLDIANYPRDLIALSESSNDHRLVMK